MGIGSRTLVALVRHLVDTPWPRSDEERETLFDRQGVTSGHRYELTPGSPSHEVNSLDVGYPRQVFATWSSFKGDS